MMRSLYAGVSGLENHQLRMDVIGNNISNINTIGFKKGRVNFQDLLSQTMQGSAAPTTELGGVDPQQVGLGMSVASIDTLQQQGSLETTGVASDVAIQGNGFFVLRDGDKQFYTRAGDFTVDANGDVVNPGGLRVQGWMAQNVNGQSFINTAADPTDLNIPIGSKDAAQATTQVLLASNLDKRTPDIPAAGATAAEVRAGTHTIEKDIYDSFGNVHTLRIDFTKVPGINNQWRATVTVDPNAATPTNTTADIGPVNATGNTFVVNFDNFGALQSATDPQGDTINNGQLQVQVGFNVAGATPGPGGVLPRQTFNLSLGTVGSMVNSVTQFAAKSSTKAYSQDGYPMGYLEGYKIDHTGVITGEYSNGTRKPIGQIALASFTNPGGLEKAGDSTFAQTNNSGEANISASGVAGKGSLLAGALEMSNVDLAEELTDMIVTERGFQANSRTIQTSDQMLQTVLTLKQ